MWSQTILCLLVGFALASQNPAWDSQYLYVYEVRGRSLASLDQISDVYSGIVYKAELEIQPISESRLGARISHIQYVPLHVELEDGWESEIPDSQLGYQQLPFPNQPFFIDLKKGAFRNVLVSKQIKNWQANMIKSIVSAFQLDTEATNRIASSIEILTQHESNSAVFKTMEETIVGVNEALYEIHPYPEYVLQSKPWMVPQKQLIQGDGEVIEVTKTLNFTHSEQAPSYHAGLDGIPGYQPGNKIANFLSRTSVTQAVVTGSLRKYTIQSSVTYEEIVLSPTLGDDQKGSVHNKLNVTLLRTAQPLDSHQFNAGETVEVGLVYAYNSPYETDNSPRSSNEYDHGAAPDSAESQSNSGTYSRRERSYEYNSFPSDNIEESDWHQDKPDMSEAPPSPLLPFTVGYDGQSFKLQQNVEEVVRKLAQEIGQEFPHPSKVLRQNTIGKFVTLASLVRIMDQSQIRNVASKLYSSRDQPTPAWIAYRDAVAQSGTGPALVNIKEWIQSDKISGYEAAKIIATAADSARQPTEKYMSTFNEIVQDKEIMSKPYLNESALLSYTNLIYQVYAKRQDSYGKYPVYSYGSFRTNRGREYVKSTVIPYLTSKLNDAIGDADTWKIHAYIRALGNTGFQQILEAYKPYLEGKNKASHFQRLLMITSLDKLTKSNPRVARSVLYKIYQNPSEVEPVRIAAVYQLMRTKPSPSMLQRMAGYTNVDTSDYVNAAVQSVIYSASKLEAPEYSKLRAAAESAKPLLTSEQYGVQYSQGYLRSYVAEESEQAYQQYVQIFGGKDHAIPKGIKYTVQRQLGGVNQNILNAQAMVSSVEDLINVYEEQTEEYQKRKEEKQSHQPGPWSSEYVAQLLNLKNEQREQLEGNLYLQTGAFQTFFSFDNNTFENLPQAIKEWEEKLAQNKQYQFNKMMIAQESSLALPTVLGLPFIYTYDRPIFFNFDGNVKANAQPRISTGQGLKKPDTVQAEFELTAAFTGRVQSQFGIFTPFDHQRYSAGYIKNFQLVAPLSGKFELNVQNKQLKIELQNPGSRENVRLAHYSAWPYTTKSDIYSPKPDLKIIRSQNPHRRSIVIGDKATGVGLSIQITSDERFDVASMYEKLRQHDMISAIVNQGGDESMEYVNVDVTIDPSRSTTQQVILRLGYQSEYQPNHSSSKKPDPNERVSDIPSFSDEPEKRQGEFVDQVGRDINNARVLVGDATVEFQGQSRIKYSLTAGVAKSDADSASRFMAYLRKLDRQNPQKLAYVQGVAIVPNTNGLDLDYAMQMDPTSSAYVQVLYRNQQQQQLSRVDAHVKLSKSQERVEYLKQQDQYEECKQQMHEGNTQLPICARATAEANLLDEFSIKTKYSNMDPWIVNATYKLYSALRHELYPRVEENIIDPASNNRLDIEGQFAVDLRSVNFSIASEYGQVEVSNVPVGPLAKHLLVPHPVFHAKARLEAIARKDDTYRPICVVDKTKGNTFDNKTYPLNLPAAWTVVLQYVPRRPSPSPSKPDLSVPEQLHEQVESYVVLAKSSGRGSGEKEVQIVVQMPSTQGKFAKIAMKPRQGKGPKVFVNEQEVQYNAESSYDFYNGNIQVYALPNQEVKVEVQNAFYVIFNGETLKLTSVNSKFRDASRGLCGTFTGEEETDFLAPDNCIVKDPQEFVDRYTVEPHSRKQQSEGQECYQRKVAFADYISNTDIGHADYHRSSSASCTKHVEKYFEEDDSICFTIRPVPACKSHCMAMGLLSKEVAVTCKPASETTRTWRDEVDRGVRHNWGAMPTTKFVRTLVPAQCVP